MQRDDIVSLLLHTPLEDLMAQASAVRRQSLGDHVCVRGLIEFSNRCICDCHYCGLRRSNPRLRRYRLDHVTIMDCARAAVAAGVDTIVLQSGEDPAHSAADVAELVAGVKSLGVAVTLGLGERPRRDYALWKEAGADRYLLKHETSDPRLYAALHPGRTLRQRLECLRHLAELGYAVGSGFIVGLPGQSPEILADDILLVRRLHVAMCGAGPFIPQADTPLGHDPRGDVQLTLRVMSILRLALPQAHLPATTALATLDPVAGQRDGLLAGGDVLMPSFTPDACRKEYRIYDHKQRVGMEQARAAIEAAGRTHALPPLPPLPPLP